HAAHDGEQEDLDVRLRAGRERHGLARGAGRHLYGANPLPAAAPRSAQEGSPHAPRPTHARRPAAADARLPAPQGPGALPAAARPAGPAPLRRPRRAPLPTPGYRRPPPPARPSCAVSGGGAVCPALRTRGAGTGPLPYAKGTRRNFGSVTSFVTSSHTTS